MGVARQSAIDLPPF